MANDAGGYNVVLAPATIIERNTHITIQLPRAYTPELARTATRQTPRAFFFAHFSAAARAVSRMSASEHARDEEPAGGAGGPPPPVPARPAPPEAPTNAALCFSRDVGFGDEPLSRVVAFLAPLDCVRLAATCRETWRYIPPGLCAVDADRVRRDHPLWKTIIDFKYRWSQKTRLGLAASVGNLARVRELCDWRADIEAAGEHGCTPLHYASDHGHLDVVCELLVRGANIEAAMSDGTTCLYVASSSGHLDVVRELLARGANIEAAAKYGWTSLLMASQESHLDVMRELLARGANANAAANSGTTPLIQASWCGHVEVVRVLLAAGAGKHHATNKGATATSVAGNNTTAPPGSRAAILVLLAAAP